MLLLVCPAASQNGHMMVCSPVTQQGSDFDFRAPEFMQHRESIIQTRDSLGGREEDIIKEDVIEVYKIIHCVEKNEKVFPKH